MHNEDFGRLDDRYQESEVNQVENENRFFRTVAGPGATAYPGEPATVYYVEWLLDVTYDAIPGNQSLEFTPSGEFDHVFNLEASNYMDEGDVGLAFLMGRQWFTIDKVPANRISIRKLTADDPPAETWKTHDYGVRSLAFQPSDSSIYAGAWVLSQTNPDDKTLHRINSDGSLAWGIETGFVQVNRIIVEPGTGDLYLVGRHDASDVHDEVVVEKRQADGTLIWSIAQISIGLGATTFASNGFMNDAVFDPSGNLYAVGGSRRADNPPQAHWSVIKLSPAGVELDWFPNTQNIGNGKIEEYTACAFDAGGDFYLAHDDRVTVGKPPGVNYGIRKLSAGFSRVDVFSSDIAWTVDPGIGLIRRVMLSSDESILFCCGGGGSLAIGPTDPQVAAINSATGDVLWTARYGDTIVYDMAIDSDDNVIVCGHRTTEDETDYDHKAYDVDGNLLWQGDHFGSVDNFVGGAVLGAFAVVMAGDDIPIIGGAITAADYASAT